MSNLSHPLGALELLQEYNDHRLEKDRAIEYIEENVIEPDNTPSYEAIVEENKRLKEQCKQHEADIDKLKTYIEELEGKLRENTNVKLVQNDTDVLFPTNLNAKIENSIPTRSNNRTINRKKPPTNIQSLNSPEPENTSRKFYGEENLDSIIHQEFESTSPNIAKTHIKNKSTDSTSNYGANSTAKTMLYPSSINSKENVSPIRTRSPMRDRLESPQKGNRITAVINNHIHSPLNESFSPENDIHIFDQPELSFTNSISKSPLMQLRESESTDQLGFSPSSKGKIDDFSQLLDKSFSSESNNKALTQAIGSHNEKLDEIVKLSPSILQNENNSMLGSPIIIDKKVEKKSTDTHSPLSLKHKEIENNHNLHISDTKFTHSSNSSSASSSSAESQDDDNLSNNKSIPLFVEPKDFGTIKLDVLSTLYIDNEMHSRERLVLIKTVDRKTNKEIFRFSKSLYKIYEMDNQLRTLISQYSLPPLPDKQYFENITPMKVNTRREKINEYFSSLFSIPNLNKEAGLLIARFISTNTVINSTEFGDSLKEGHMLTRKQKALSSGQQWKINYAVLNDNTLNLIENENTVDSISIINSSIEPIPAVLDSKHGTVNGFQIIEHKGGLSSNSKYYMCLEAFEDKSDWLDVLNSITPIQSPTDKSPRMDVISERSRTNLNQSSPSSPSKSIETYEKRDQKKGKRSFFPFKRSAGSSSQFPDTEEVTTPDSATTKYFSGNSSNFSSNTMYSKGVFGVSVEDAIKLSSHKLQNKYEIPSIVYRCLEFLYTNGGLKEEGIFRLSGSSALIRVLQEKFNTEYDINLCTYEDTSDTISSSVVDINSAAGLLKLYLRNLPHLIFGDEFYQLFKNAAEADQSPAVIALEFKKIITSPSISEAKLSLMYSVFELLKKTMESREINKMGLKNICIVFSPTLNIPINILQPFIVDFNCIFKGEDPIPDNQRELIDVDIPQL